MPTLRLLDRTNTVWSVMGFHGRLRWEIVKTGPRVGDFIAIAYRGVIPTKKKGMNDAHDYAVAVERNPDLVVVDTNSRGNDVLAGADPVRPIPADDAVLDEITEEPEEGVGAMGTSRSSCWSCGSREPGPPRLVIAGRWLCFACVLEHDLGRRVGRVPTEKADTERPTQTETLFPLSSIAKKAS